MKAASGLLVATSKSEPLGLHIRATHIPLSRPRQPNDTAAGGQAARTCTDVPAAFPKTSICEVLWAGG